MKRIQRVFVFALSSCVAATAAAVAPASATWWENPTSASPVTQGEVKAAAGGGTSEAWQINWPGGTVRVMAGATADMSRSVNEAHARSVAIKTARHLAYEKLAETVKGIRIDSDSTYDRELMLDSNLRTHVAALVQGARVIEERVTKAEDGAIWAEVSLELSLYGTGPTLAGPTSHWVLENEKIHRRSFDTPQTVGKPPAPGDFGAGALGLDGTPSGIVIDATGLGGAPAMLPRIVTDDGRVVYSAGDVPSEYLVQHGLAGYAATVAEARASERAGSSPLVIRALRMQGADAVVSAQDAATLIAANNQAKLLDKCRVVVVLGEKGGVR